MKKPSSETSYRNALNNKPTSPFTTMAVNGQKPGTQLTRPDQLHTENDLLEDTGNQPARNHDMNGDRTSIPDMRNCPPGAASRHGDTHRPPKGNGSLSRSRKSRHERSTIAYDFDTSRPKSHHNRDVRFRTLPPSYLVDSMDSTWLVICLTTLREHLPDGTSAAYGSVLPKPWRDPDCSGTGNSSIRRGSLILAQILPSRSRYFSHWHRSLSPI